MEEMTQEDFNKWISEKIAEDKESKRKEELEVFFEDEMKEKAWESYLHYKKLKAIKRAREIELFNIIMALIFKLIEEDEKRALSDKLSHLTNKENKHTHQSIKQT